MFDDTESPGLKYLALPARLHGMIRYRNTKSLAAMDMTVSVDEESAVLKYVVVSDANDMMINSGYKVASGFMAATWTLQIREMNDMTWLWAMSSNQKTYVPLKVLLNSCGDPSSTLMLA